MIGTPRRVVFWLALLSGLAATFQAAWIPAKAWLAQFLLEQAWAQQRVTGRAARPWPWADMAPLARLRQPRLGVDQIVLDGASGRVLAFGPGHVTGSARPGGNGNAVVSAHRDTHFRWLRDVRRDDVLLIDTVDGATLRYRVATLAVHHESETHLLDPAAGEQLRLMTCFPFSGVDPGPTLRYVVTAYPL